MSHTPDEAQLTAYLLGELTAEDAAQVEAQLAVSAALQEELAGLRQTVASLEAALASQTAPAVPAINRDQLHMLLQSAVGQAILPVPSGVGSATSARNPADKIVYPTAGLASLPRPTRSRGWLVAASVLVVGGLIGLSQWEVGTGPQNLALLRSEPRDRESQLSLSSTREKLARGRGVVTELEKESLMIHDATESERLLLAEQMVVNNSTAQQSMFGAFNDPLAANGTVATQVAGRPLIRSLSTASSSPAPTPFGTVVLSDGASPAVDSYEVDAGVRFALPASGGVAYPYYTHTGARAYFRNSGVTNQSLVSDPAPVLNFAFARRRFERAPSPGQLGNTDGDALLSFSPQPSSTFLDLEYAETEVRAKGLPQLQGLDLLTDLSAVDGRDSTALGLQVDHLWAEPVGLAKGRYITEAKERNLEQLSEAVDESPASHLASSLPTSLTVADYENGFVQLGQAVQGWEEFHSHWYRQRCEALDRGTQLTPPDEATPATTDFIEVTELSKLVADQQTEFKSLRAKTPGIEGKPLTEVAPEAAKKAELALLRVRRELAREQAVWYYREGYVQQLEATIAAAEQYAHVPENDFTTPVAQPLSTFGIDVDTASYSNVRRFVESKQLPPPDAVRVEELINSFSYDGPKVEGEHPLAIAAEVSACPWQPQHRLLRVALKGKTIDLQQRPPARLVFLVDTSGSMSDENKLPLVKQSLRLLVEQMREQDRLSIVTYSDNAGLLLDSTGGDKREAMLAAIEGLSADGSTNGEAGLKLAYEVAVKQFGEGATNRVMLCTDGDFNVGESADSELVKLIEKQRQTGVFLNIFGFGSGNLKDAKLEAIADKGNGQYLYIDGIKEARKTLLNELTGTLYTIAKDVKLQLEFNPNLVGSYRLVGYENRVMAAKDFSNDKVDSGDMGAGHSVVALYEIVPAGLPQPVAPQPETEPLKYQRAGSVSARSEQPAPADKPAEAVDVAAEAEAETPAPPADPVAAAEASKPADPLATELCTIRVRYKQPTSNESTKIETVVADPMLLLGNNAPTSKDHVWATAVAQFGLLLRHSSFVGSGNYSQVLELAQSAIGDDPTGQRREFVTLVRQTQHLSLERERQVAELSRRAEEHRRVVDEIKTVEKAPDVMTKASVAGKYRTLLRRIEVADDLPTYGEFQDFGRWEGAAYKTHEKLPGGYWVYVAPHWYIWGESAEQAAVK